MMKRAHAYLRAHAEKIMAEDVEREMELMLAQLETPGVAPPEIPSVNGYLRVLVREAVGRARRRRKLIEQIGAGDDLDAVSDDLARLDKEPAPVPEPLFAQAKEAQARLELVKLRLSPADSLLFALLFEDDIPAEVINEALLLDLSEIADARARIVRAAVEAGLNPDLDPLEATI
jgi:hypothetical protein